MATVGLALSGGGFRATLFGLGSLCRLNEMGMLRKIARISSVSGGSIAAGYLGFKWKELSFNEQGVATNFPALIVAPLREFCRESVDRPGILKGLFTPRKSIADYIAAKYNKELFTKPDGTSATLQDLPSDNEGPRFVICATSLQTRACVRFSKPYIGDFNLGRLRNPTTTLAVAVGASSAFPPVLSPVILKTNPMQWSDDPKHPPANLHDLRKEMVLTDGGVYDNLGLEPLWDKVKKKAGEQTFDVVLCSDAGAPANVKSSPWRIWPGQLGRVREIMMEQTRALRRRWLVEELRSGRVQGAFWGVATRIADYKLEDALIDDSEMTVALQNVPTRLKPMSDQQQCELINWGYALCDAAMRRFVVHTASRPGVWPVTSPVFPPPRPQPPPPVTTALA